MPGLSEKIQNALDESRMLMLGAQVLVGFHFRATLEQGFERLPSGSKAALVTGLSLLLVAIGLLLWPSAYHQVVCRGADRPDAHSFATRIMCTALCPIAGAFCIDLYVAALVVSGPLPAGLLAGLAAAMVSTLWMLWPTAARHDRTKEYTMHEAPQSESEKRDINVRHVLTEARVVLPGAQALLGFGTIAVLMRGFEDLPPLLQVVHLISLCLIALATAILMTPAAYHRLAENGESSERFLRVASRLLLAGMAALGAGLALDFWMVMEKVTGVRTAGMGAGLALLGLLYSMWFGWTWWRRQHPRRTN